MKKALAIAAFIAAMFIAGNVQAQSMIYACYAPEKFTQTVGSSTSTSKYQGFCAGFTQNFRLSQGKVGIGVATGAYFRMNTKTESSTFLGMTTTAKDSQFLIDVPIPFNFTININRDYSITPFFVGPMLSLALAGNTKTSIGSSTSTIDWYGDNSNLSRFNLYAVFGTGAMINHFNLYCGYRLGLLDLNSSDNVTLKTNGFFVGLGFSL